MWPFRRRKAVVSPDRRTVHMDCAAVVEMIGLNPARITPTTVTAFFVLW